MGGSLNSVWGNDILEDFNVNEDSQVLENPQMLSIEPTDVENSVNETVSIYMSISHSDQVTEIFILHRGAE